MDSQGTGNNMTELAAGHREAMVKPNAPLPPQGFQARPQGPPPRNSINDSPVGAPRQPGPPLRRLDSRSSLGPPVAGQFVQLRPYGPPRPPPPGGPFPPRPPQPPGQLPPQNPLHPANQRFAHPPQPLRGPPPPPSSSQGQRPPFVGGYQQPYQQAQQQPPRGSNDPQQRFPRPDIAPQNGPAHRPPPPPPSGGQDPALPRQLLRNDSSLSLQRQLLLSNEEIKQPTRPRIVIERMADISEIGADKPEGCLPRGKGAEGRESSDNSKDDDDDVVMDNGKSPRHWRSGEGLANGSKSPLTSQRQDEGDVTATAATPESKTERRDSTTKLISAAPRSNRPASATSNGKEDEERKPSGPREGDASGSDFGQSLKTPSRSSDSSRSGTPSRLDVPQNAEPESRTPSKSPDKSRASTPGAPEPTVNAEQESRTPIKTPDKSRTATPTGLEPPRKAERESRASKSPDSDKSEAPASTPDKTRSVTPAEAGKGEADEPVGNSQRDDAQRARQPGGLSPSPDSPDSRHDGDVKSARSPGSSATPENQKRLSVPGSATTPPRSPAEGGVKGFDNGQPRSLSSRTPSGSSPRSPSSPRPSADGAKRSEFEKKRTSFAEEPTVVETAGAEAKTSVTARRGAETPSKPDDERIRRKSSEKTAAQNGSDSQAVPTANGVAESPTKKDVDKRSNAGSPTKSPSKSAKSLPRTPETPSSTIQEKKKVPMNKVQVGAAPSPNLKTVRSKIGSLDNTSYKPGGGKVKIENRKLDFSKAQPKIAAKNEKYAPSGGDKKISQVKLQWNAKSKIGSLDNTTYKPGGGDKKIETVKLDFKDKAKSKVGSKDNAKHVPGGGTVKSATSPKTPQEVKNDIPTQKVDIKAESKIGSMDNVKHKPGGGDKKIFNDRDYLRQTSSNVESVNGSGSQSPVPPGAITDGKNGLPASDENLNQEC